jgi:hypothetical protein
MRWIWVGFIDRPKIELFRPFWKPRLNQTI